MDINKIAEDALATMIAAGFDKAQVSAGIAQQDELNIAHDEASLFRSTEDYSLALMGIVDGRKAAADLTDLSEDNISRNVDELLERAKLAPQDDANTVSSGQTGDIVQGPQSGDLDLMARSVEEILAYRAKESPLMHLDEGTATHALSKDIIVTSEGSRLTCSIGCYGLIAMGTATDGENVSSFNYTGGNTNALGEKHAAEYFGIDEMLKETEKQIITKGLDGNFKGDVVMAPTAVSDLISWFLGQLSDGQLIADASLYKDSVGDDVASSLLTIKSHFDGAGMVAFSGDGFVAEPFTLLDEGKLLTLLPGLYGSRKTGLPHRPTGSGWKVEPGKTPRADLISAVKKGALVNRLSMGSPAANGDFSGVIKNSFVIEGGTIGAALSETMISGNVGQMLRDIVAVSAEHVDNGGEDLPWLRITGLNFS